MFDVSYFQNSFKLCKALKVIQGFQDLYQFYQKKIYLKNGSVSLSIYAVANQHMKVWE